MYNAFIAFISVLLLGGIIYWTAWWEGSWVSLRFTKWFFTIFLIAAVITGICTYVGKIQF
ncbi:hypothetical protein EDM56_01905 [Brevibacillus fluminis]|uniref:Uncharacterized protein n=1 Tax=Brevibacillus fluminis TaxID=511487 RepID=A0A3M8DWK3_9BACL|nr:hypothetical protein [Brevibacillus fluminis]RNB92472.1 hypothetical protein EDM56_01905 [Brevibacillus fluminis]